MARAIGLLSLSLMLVVAMAWAADSSLPDPTLPPTIVTTQAKSAAADGGQPVSLLQTVILRNNAKPAAIIGGELVELGGHYGEARLVMVKEDSVVLDGPGGRETLLLLPGAEKKVTKTTDGSGGKPLRGKSK